MSSTASPKPPRIAAILVVSNGIEWLPSALATVVEQRYPALDLIVVDNASTDGSAAMLERRIPEDRLLLLGDNLGFGRAVAEALKHEAVERADLILLLHDDLALGPDSIARLAQALVEDPSLSIVGPKLREWSEDPVLQEVGMTIDRFGRAESRIEPGELDQGQWDRQRETMYVSTAGMLLRREVLRDLGGFDARFPAIRDDLDLCWRAWLAGHRVEIVPEAVAYHVAGTSSLARAIGRGREWEPRYLAERHTLAALLKNYGSVRLALTLPVVVLLALVKTLAFVMTRRFGEAAAVARAYAWNIAQLPRTLRRRRVVQSRRAVSDAEILRLFAPGLPRARSYGEAVFNWLAGGSSRALAEETEPVLGPPQPAESGFEAAARIVRTHPTAFTAGLLAAAYLVGVAPLLGSGQITGGQIAPWPSSARDFLSAYGSPWGGEPAASPFFASPVVALLGILSYLGAGSAWLAQRLLVFGLLPLAWLLALRAGRLITSRPAPRVLGATLYVLSPAVLAPLAQGHYGALIAAALLPAVILGAANATVTDRAPGSAWRAAALLALGLTAITGAAPVLGAALWVAYLMLLAGLALSRRLGWGPVLRLAIAAAAALALLGPWLFGVIATRSLDLAFADLLAPAAGGDRLPLLSALLAVPPLWTPDTGIVPVLAAAAIAAVILAAILLGMATRSRTVAWLVTLAAVFGLTCWGLGEAGLGGPWARTLLIPVALAHAGLGVVAARCLLRGLRTRSFGVRQLAVVLAGVTLIAGLAAGLLRVADSPWEGLTRGTELLPAFVAADESRVGPYRVVLLAGEGDQIRWDVVAAQGPSMEQFGSVHSPELIQFIHQAVTAAVGGADIRGGAELGLANVRYLVLADPAPAGELRDALSRQPFLEPLPSHSGRVYRVRSWLPRAAIVPGSEGQALLEGADRPPDAGEARGLRQAQPGLYTGNVPPEQGGVIVLSEDSSPLWQARVGGVRLRKAPLPPVNAFLLSDRDGIVEVRAVAAAHRLIVVGQIVVVLALVSLVLRPPGISQRRRERAGAGPLPSDVPGAERAGPGAAGGPDASVTEPSSGMPPAPEEPTTEVLR